MAFRKLSPLARGGGFAEGKDGRVVASDFRKQSVYGSGVCFNQTYYPTTILRMVPRPSQGADSIYPPICTRTRTKFDSYTNDLR